MSKSTKRKHVTHEVTQDFVVPEGKNIIVKVVGGRGNNLHEIETPDGDKYLVSMPTKFRKNVWIKRGDFVLIQPIEEGEKVKGEIINILYGEQIKYIQSQGKWPDKFNHNEASKEEKQSPVGDYKVNSNSDSDSDDLFVNTNRPECKILDESSEDSEEDKNE